MAPYLRSTVFLILTTAAAEAQGNLSEVFSITRKEGPVISEADRSRTFEILRHYSTGESLSGEWQTLNEALSDPTFRARSSMRHTRHHRVLEFGSASRFARHYERASAPRIRRDDSESSGECCARYSSDGRWSASGHRASVTRNGTW